MSNTLSSSQTSHVVHTLHSILKPFLLRRLKADVELSLPPKKEYILYAPLTERQKDIYSAVVDGGIRRYLLEGKLYAEAEQKKKKEEEEQKRQMMTEGRKLRTKNPNIKYDFDGSDKEYFEKLESGQLNWMDKGARERGPELSIEEYHRKAASAFYLPSIMTHS